ncbi:MAG TPA: hypothetical protein VKZ53_00520 [Candidatus Angelobacter sp.]|nr:hypothetical protein [Candidatus Angelobacter sp.]
MHSRLVILPVLVSLADLLIGCLMGCGGNSTASPLPVSSQHLYVGVGSLAASGSGEIQQFTLPITDTSTPTVRLPMSFVSGLAVDSNGNIAAGDGAGNLEIFKAPLSGTTTISAAFSNGFANGQPAFSAAGDLFVTDDNNVDVFAPPFTSASTPSQVIGVITASGFNRGAALDANGNLILSNLGGAVSTVQSNLLVLAPPYIGPAIATPFQADTFYMSVALSSTQLFVVSALGNQRIDVYNLPITANSEPAFSITSGLSLPKSVALDSNGNLYVGNLVNITAYSAPLSSSSTPSATLRINGLAGNDLLTLSSIAIGK